MLKQYSKRKILIRVANASLLVFCASFVGASDDTDEFISEVATPTIAVHCGNAQFLKFTGMSQKTCFSVLRKHSMECNKIIRPMIPEVTGTDKDRERLKMVGSIGSMYSMCLKALVYEDGYCLPNELRAKE